MYHKRKSIKYLTAIILNCVLLLANGQLNVAKLSDTALARKYLDVAKTHASINNDSAIYYVNLAEELAVKNNSENLLAQTYYLKAKVYFFMANFSEAQHFQRKGLILAAKLKDQNLLGKLYNVAGASFYSLGDYENALKQYNNRLNINILQHDTSGMLQAYYNTSLIYNVKAEHRKTIESTYKALDLAEKVKDSTNLMALTEALGMAYYQLAEHDKAIEFLNRAYAISVLKKEEYYQCGILIDFGNIYQGKKEHSKATNYYNKAIAVSKKNGDKRRLAIATSNKATSLIELKDYKNALIIVEDAIKIDREINYAKGLSDALSVKAECLMGMGKAEEGLKYALEAKDITLKIKARKEEYTSYDLLNKIYEALKNKPKAFYYYKRFINLKDTVESKEEIRAVSGIEFNYEKEKMERRQKHDRELAAAQLKKQKQIRNIISGAGIIMLGLFFFILRSYGQKQKANIEIKKQHEILEQKNAAILQGITYSRKIQEAISTPEEIINKLLPQSFVLYKPKDIVSGDFYFIEPIFPLSNNEKWVAVALADCTGHGVPGALMSLTGYTILKQSLREPTVNGPGEALDFLNKELYSFLKQNQREQQIRDGMDISFCALNVDTMKLMFAGANNPLWIISEKQNLCDIQGKALSVLENEDGKFVYELKANKQPIGYSEKSEKFLTHEIELQKGDLLYLFTDGYADQFGGDKGKKLKYKSLREIILKNAAKEMKIQKELLNSAFDNWKGNLEQVDDVSIIGIKV